MRIAAGIDIETTGLSQQEGHKIIEIAILLCDLDTQKRIGQYVRRINPERAIDSKAQAVHGISFSDVSACPTWDDIGPQVGNVLRKASVLIAHNTNFDLPFIAGELARIKQPVPRVPHICTMEHARWATANGKSPSLLELCFSLGVPFDTDQAHGALYDVDMTMNCFFKGLQWGFYQLPEQLTVKEAA